ncbi:DoxX family protein [Williamsia sp. DF01-3]|uniref:DoxX family protein n=1 Tax=Williamsia sp. DF01-3 TaxID=2934157 RepID=UPI001FF25A9E|nr:DoxX family protein [Williamsia sp. DF01-3]MCK0516669.1 DoxX family protein [Williamsia sp. DF01-3]
MARDRSDSAGVALLLRVAVGGTMLAHGLTHARSLAGTAGWFESIGFRQPRAQARASAVVEMGAGAAILAGAATPVAAAAVVGTMAVAARSVHLSNGFFITAEGWEYVANMAVGAVALAGVGPGPWSVDKALGLEQKFSGNSVATLTAGVGIAAAAGQLALFYRPSK